MNSTSKILADKIKGTKIINIKNSQIVISKTFTEKLFGLMFRKKFPKNKSAMLIKNANWIHTLFMKMTIDVVYLNKDNQVVDLQDSLKPWRFCKPRFKAKHLIELPENYIKNLSINKQDTINFQD